MKKGLIAGLLTLSCFNGYAIESDFKAKAPFGLEWKQKIDSTSIATASNCSSVQGAIFCAFNNVAPFNGWSEDNALIFRDGALTSVISSFSDSEIESSNPKICGVVEQELDYLAGLGVDTSKLKKYKPLCEEKNRGKTMSSTEVIDVSYGTVKLKLMRMKELGVIGTVTYKISE